jgi:hypothetical protein
MKQNLELFEKQENTEELEDDSQTQLSDKSIALSIEVSNSSSSSHSVPFTIRSIWSADDTKKVEEEKMIPLLKTVEN